MPIRRGRGRLTSTVEDLLILSRHFDNPALGKRCPHSSPRCTTDRRACQPLSPRAFGIGEVRGLRRSAMRIVAGLPH